MIRPFTRILKYQIFIQMCYATLATHHLFHPLSHVSFLPWNNAPHTDILDWMCCIQHNTRKLFLSSLTKSTLSSASQWKHLRKSRRVKRATKRGEKSSLNTVNARHVSVTAYQERSMRCWQQSLTDGIFHKWADWTYCHLQPRHYIKY